MKWQLHHKYTKDSNWNDLRKETKEELDDHWNYRGHFKLWALSVNCRAHQRKTASVSSWLSSWEINTTKKKDCIHDVLVVVYLITDQQRWTKSPETWTCESEKVNEMEKIIQLYLYHTPSRKINFMWTWKHKSGWHHETAKSYSIIKSIKQKYHKQSKK